MDWKPVNTPNPANGWGQKDRSILVPDLPLLSQKATDLQREGPGSPTCSLITSVLTEQVWWDCLPQRETRANPNLIKSLISLHSDLGFSLYNTQTTQTRLSYANHLICVAWVRILVLELTKTNYSLCNNKVINRGAQIAMQASGVGLICQAKLLGIHECYRYKEISPIPIGFHDCLYKKTKCEVDIWLD